VVDASEERTLILHQLLAQPRLRAADLGKVLERPGIYVIHLDAPDPLCLKLGIAGPRRKDGLRGRLDLHFRSNPSNTVLARHMIADATPIWAANFDFRIQAARSAFLSARCFFQILERQEDEPRLRELERFLEGALRPRYRGRVGGRHQT
jgi:hypothetical protein